MSSQESNIRNYISLILNFQLAINKVKKPLILHFIDSLGIGGAEILLKETVLGLKEYDHVICYLSAPHTLASELNGICLHHLNHTSWIQSFQTIRSLKNIIRQYQPKLIHAHLFKTTLLVRLATPKSIPLFFTIHNIMSEDAFKINRLALWAEKATYKRSHTILAVSEAVINDYNNWVGIKGSSFVLYNYVAQRFFKLKYKGKLHPTKELRLVAVGNLRRQKNYNKLLEAFELLKNTPISLDIYGDGDLKDEFAKIIVDKQLRVRLMGRVEDVSTILLNYDAYIMPSLFEGFGIAPMEAMATGMPVLLSDIPVFRELAGEVPVFFDPLNPASIAGAIKKVIDDWEKILAGAKHGREVVYNKASRETYFKKLIEIYTHR